MKNITLENYVKSCMAFAEDSKDWGRVPERSFFLSDGYGGYSETCDGGMGIDVSWAFRCTPEEIKEEAPHRFVSALLEEVQCGAEEQYDEVMWDAVLERFGY